MFTESSGCRCVSRSKERSAAFGAEFRVYGAGRAAGETALAKEARDVRPNRLGSINRRRDVRVELRLGRAARDGRCKLNRPTSFRLPRLVVQLPGEYFESSHGFLRSACHRQTPRQTLAVGCNHITTRSALRQWGKYPTLWRKCPPLCFGQFGRTWTGKRCEWCSPIARGRCS